MALIEGLPHIKDSSITLEKFMEDELVFISSLEHRFASKRCVEIGELEGENFIIREQGSGTREIIENRLNEIGVNLNIVYEFNNSEAIKNAVSANLGISALSSLVIRNELKTKRLKRINIRNFKMKRWFYFLKIKPYNKAQNLFISYISSKIKGAR
jgi:DNA-binding transcriptional LysR family regulator